MRVFRHNLFGVVAIAFLVAAPCSRARAQTLFYNGSFSGSWFLNSSSTAGSSSMVFDNFLVSGAGWNVSGLFGDYQAFRNGWSTASWEIRSGVSNGVGGSLLFSGVSPAAFTPLDVSLGYYRASVTGLSFFLAPGTYWMGLSPIVPSGYSAAIGAQSTGIGGVNPLIDQSFFWQSPPLTYYPVPTDVAYGLTGTPAEVVPEPATMSLLATGLAGMAGAGVRRRRKQR